MSPSNPQRPDPGRAHDDQRLRQAVAAAQAVRRTVSPRPWVGAVVVPTGAPVDHPGFAGATQGRADTDGRHAEVVALQAAGAAARGGTLYATLEPCAHPGRRPASCVQAIIDAGISRVVVAVVDPDPRVSGQGLAELAGAGLLVELAADSPGLEGAAAAAEQQLQPYLHHRRTGRPFVILKLAATLDGRTAAPDGTSQWITGPAARLDAHRLRADCDAILVGAGTVRADDPALTVRLPADELAPGFVQPRRLVLGSVAPDAAVQPAQTLEGDLGPALAELGHQGVLQLLVEGGARVAHELHGAGLVDRYVLYLAPALFGGDDARGLFAGPGAPTLDELWRGTIVATRVLDGDLRLDLEPARAVGFGDRPATVPAGG